MNVVDNLNSVYVINKPCMSSRNMCLLPRATLRRDREHVHLHEHEYVHLDEHEHIHLHERDT